MTTKHTCIWYFLPNEISFYFAGDECFLQCWGVNVVSGKYISKLFFSTPPGCNQNMVLISGHIHLVTYMKTKLLDPAPTTIPNIIPADWQILTDHVSENLNESDHDSVDEFTMCSDKWRLSWDGNLNLLLLNNVRDKWQFYQYTNFQLSISKYRASKVLFVVFIQW